VNLTHRNWTAVGIPGCDVYPLVDPRGLVTPFWDGWSLDCWVLGEDEHALLPSRLPAVQQMMEYVSPHDWTVQTAYTHKGVSVASRAWVEMRSGQPLCRIQYNVQAPTPVWCVIALRPYNPEGISFVHDIALDSERTCWTINGRNSVCFHRPVERHAVSTYQQGDVFHALPDNRIATTAHCSTGLATAAAQYRIPPQDVHPIELDVRLTHDPETSVGSVVQISSWDSALQHAARLSLPQDRLQYLYESAVRSLILLTPDLAYPGPYTYKRFWYRDAVFITHALLCINLQERVETLLDRFPDDQGLTGYFHSQAGEWDSNGEVLWAFSRFCQLSGKMAKENWLEAVRKGAKWIQRKRLTNDDDALHTGLFPAGFSAEHLGNVDYYYWDDFWGVAGLFSAAMFLENAGKREEAQAYRQQADDFLRAISRSLERSRSIRNFEGLPASPYRRMDAGAVGSLVAGYPLQLYPALDSRLLRTVEFLQQRCFVRGALFQDMIHSGMNAYLSLHIAQVLLRAADPGFYDIVRAVAHLASGTGQWPEAIHPRTGGGCMGDGHHAWASAEWVMMMRNMFVREEGERLVLASGIMPELLESGESLAFGPTPTPFGPVKLRVEPGATTVRISWEANWRTGPPAIDVALPGQAVQRVEAGNEECEEVRILCE
jgi:hypothetical protein